MRGIFLVRRERKSFRIEKGLRGDILVDERILGHVLESFLFAVEFAWLYSPMHWKHSGMGVLE